MRLRLTSACPQGYAGTTGVWLPGTEKDVEGAEAERLLSAFPSWFERVDEKAHEPAATGDGPAIVHASDSPAVAKRATKPARVRGK